MHRSCNSTKLEWQYLICVDGQIVDILQHWPYIMVPCRPAQQNPRWNTNSNSRLVEMETALACYSFS
eukprot:scaffold332980_cov18-Prasinocladus_malaysianus.AAC.1